MTLMIRYRVGIAHDLPALEGWHSMVQAVPRGPDRSTNRQKEVRGSRREGGGPTIYKRSRRKHRRQTVEDRKGGPWAGRCGHLMHGAQDSPAWGSSRNSQRRGPRWACRAQTDRGVAGTG